MHRRASSIARLKPALVAALAALALTGAGVSSATDPEQPPCPVAAEGTVPGPAGPLADPQACEEQAPAETPAPAEPADPPADPPAPSEDPAPPDAPTPDDAPAPSEPPAPRDDPAPAQAAAPGDAPAAPEQRTAPSAPTTTDDPGPEPPRHRDAAAAPHPAVAEVAPATRRSAPRHRRASRTLRVPRRSHRRHRITEADVYFPPVFVDWAALTPLAPPEFGAAEATRFPGPLFLLPIYQAAAAEYDVPWQILASINEIETNYGANTRRSSAGAVGWMQFLPSTWRTYGVDADGDGVANPGDPVDAIFAAARYLHASGSVKDLGRALFSYNHANWYVARVLQRAVEIGSIPEDLLTTLTEAGRKDAGALRRATGATGYLADGARPDRIGRVMLLSDERLRDAVLGDERVQVYSCGRADIAAGVVDRRILQLAAYLAFRDLNPSLSSLRCGHSFRTKGGSVSEHSYGAAVDISRVNGIPILGHQGAGSITDRAIQELLKLGGAMRPHQIISLMTFTGAGNTLALGDHDDHIHVGFAPVRPLGGS